MASVFLRPGSKYYWAAVTLPGGQRKQFSTRLAIESEALEVAHRAEREAHRMRNETRLRGSLDRLVADVIGPSVHDPVVWLDQWLKTVTATIDGKTLTTYRTVITEAAEVLVSRKVHSMAAIGTDDIVAMRDMWGARHAVITANLKLKVFRIAMRVAWEQNVVPELIATKVENLKKEKNSSRQQRERRRPFTGTELQILLNSASPLWKVMILLGFYTGQRFGDLCTLRWSQIDLAQEVISFETDKTDATIHLPIMPPLLAALTALPSCDDPRSLVFPGLAAMTTGARSNLFSTVLEQAGLKPHVPYIRKRPGEARATRRQTFPLSFHSLRHTATTALKSAGVAGPIAQAIIGHESEAISRVYTHIDLATMRTAMEKMAVIGGS